MYTFQKFLFINSKISDVSLQKLNKINSSDCSFHASMTHNEIYSGPRLGQFEHSSEDLLVAVEFQLLHLLLKPHP